MTAKVRKITSMIAKVRKITRYVENNNSMIGKVRKIALLATWKTILV